MRGRSRRRVLAIVTMGSLVLAGLVAAANAESSVDAALHQKSNIQERIEELHETRRVRRVALHQRIKKAQAILKETPGTSRVGNRARVQSFRHRQLDKIKQARAAERRLIKHIRKRVHELRSKRHEIATWISSLPLQRCPVDGTVSVNDNFGIWHDHGEDGGHTHQGVDMGAATGSPIVATFDGNAVSNPSDAGGMAVEVFGSGGYSYNAHLSAYGKLGSVKVGDVIGYVGSTGNATGPHLHFEWHPADGEAVDPFLFLTAVC
ncbi:MAG TPA: peptidoglycan DD-metalloendopeptidase family protein [Actinomycetota bacterium]|nr:peptidoglycan DD-metalloendopeptidase family protein [Actinomycetota bacterium]